MFEPEEWNSRNHLDLYMDDSQLCIPVSVSEGSYQIPAMLLALRRAN